MCGIAEVGEMFESGALFLPELMMAAQAMEGAMEITNAALGEGGGTPVQGDVHGTQHWADQIGADAYAEDANDGVKKIDAPLSQLIRA